MRTATTTNGKLYGGVDVITVRPDDPGSLEVLKDLYKNWGNVGGGSSHSTLLHLKHDYGWLTKELDPVREILLAGDTDVSEATAKNGVVVVVPPFHFVELQIPPGALVVAVHLVYPEADTPPPSIFDWSSVEDEEALLERYQEPTELSEDPPAALDRVTSKKLPAGAWPWYKAHLPSGTKQTEHWERPLFFSLVEKLSTTEASLSPPGGVRQLTAGGYNSSVTGGDTPVASNLVQPCPPVQDVGVPLLDLLKPGEPTYHAVDLVEKGKDAPVSELAKKIESTIPGGASFGGRGSDPSFVAWASKVASGLSDYKGKFELLTWLYSLGWLERLCKDAKRAWNEE